MSVMKQRQVEIETKNQTRQRGLLDMLGLPSNLLGRQEREARAYPRENAYDLSIAVRTSMNHA